MALLRSLRQPRNHHRDDWMTMCHHRGKRLLLSSHTIIGRMMHAAPEETGGQSMPKYIPKLTHEAGIT